MGLPGALYTFQVTRERARELLPLRQEAAVRTPARVARHPIHPMLVPIPIGLWIFSLICDLVHRFGAASPNWETVAAWRCNSAQ